MKKLVLSAVFVLAALAPSALSAGVTPRLVRDAFPAPMPVYLQKAIEEAARQYRIDPNLLAAMAFKESAFDPYAVSRRGAQGILQLMPRTAQRLGVRDAFDPQENVRGGARYLRYLLDRFDGNVELALAGYNLGPERVAKDGPRATPGVVKYVSDIKRYYSAAVSAL